MSSGGTRLSPRELKLEIKAELKEVKEMNFKPTINRNTILSNMASDIFEKLDKIRRGK
jgi:predicted RNA-binding protein with PIN domain